MSFDTTPTRQAKKLRYSVDKNGFQDRLLFKLHNKKSSFSGKNIQSTYIYTSIINLYLHDILHDIFKQYAITTVILNEII
jgi:hypothetical protein